jgi:hypothetical protein
MLDTKKRSAHHMAAHPEITHLRHVEMADRALAKNSLVHGCQTLDEVAPVNKTFSGQFDDPGRNTGTICFPSKGTDAEGDCQLGPVLEHLKHEPLCSFWRVVREKMDLTGAPIESATSSMTGGQGEVGKLTFRNCQLAGFKVFSYQGAHTRIGRHQKSSLVEFEHMGGGVSTASIGLAHFYCVLSAWNTTNQRHLHIM